MAEFLNGVLVSILTTRGDMLYRNASGEARLAKGAANTVLRMGANDPEWSAILAGLTLTSPTINGTIATTGLTLPAHTVSDDITLASGADIVMGNNDLVGGTTGVQYYLYGGTKSAGKGTKVALSGVDQAQHGAFRVWTPNAAENADTQRLDISGDIDISVGTWSNITHSGLSVTDGQNIVVGTGIGSSFGAAANQKSSFHGVTPVVQAAHIADPAAEVNQLAGRVADILVVLENKGLTAAA